jgi:hypothetical protein
MPSAAKIEMVCELRELATLEGATLSVFRIADDERLHFERSHPLDTTRGSLFWIGIPTFQPSPLP